jgi:N-methylhydantoinase A
MSGPVGGVTGATGIAQRLRGNANLVTLDIGGTSADVAIIDQGDPVGRSVGHIGPWPIMVPMVDIESIGAGGGSIAAVDAFGKLSVGPESAGAVPGPACLGHGGASATVTDANLVVGRLNPSYYLAGELRLDEAAARRAIDENVARLFSMTCEEAALGVITVINSNMTRLLWEVMISRGYDPRDFALFAFGGAGPLHACELAQALGIQEVLIPKDPGAFSAVGILMADARRDYERMLVGVGPNLGAVELENAYKELESEARIEVDRARGDYMHVEYMRAAELRYLGQDHALSVDVPAAEQGEGDALSIARRLFHDKHDRLYGFRRDQAPVELVRIQVTAVARIRRHEQLDAVSGTHSRNEPKAVRKLFLDGAFREALVYERDQLAVGVSVSGPCVVEEPTSTTFVPSGCELEARKDGILYVAVPPMGGSTNERQ